MFQRKIFKFFLVIISFLIIVSCKEIKEPAVIFTFDDHYINSWYSKQELFSKYGIRATFYINRPFNINDHENQLLKVIASNGHEIGCHGLNHLNAPEFLKNSTLTRYITDEITPAVKIFDSLGYKVSTFAYPFGEHTEKTDSALLNYFNGLRLATYKWEDTSLECIDRLFIKDDYNRVVNALMIDNAPIDITEIEKALIRIKENHETLIFLAHGIDSVDGLFVPSSYLEDIFKLCQKHKIKTLTMQEYFNPR